MKYASAGLVALVVLAGGAGRARAAFIQNDFGLVSPAQTINFDEHVFGKNTPITNQYADLGVTFSPNLFFSPETGFPNMSGDNLGNYTFPDLIATNPITIGFSQNQTAAAFALVTNPNATTFTALLNGVAVETATVDTNFMGTKDFYGFEGIVFNEIRIDVGNDHRLLIDNLQTSTPVATPEPGSLVLLGVGGLGMLGAKLRRRKGAAGVAAAP